LNPTSRELIHNYQAALLEQAEAKQLVQDISQMQRNLIMEQRLQLHYFQEQQKKEIRSRHRRKRPIETKLQVLPCVRGIVSSF
jgi:adenylate kinase